MILTGVVVFVIVAGVFRSVFVPLRLLLTIALPICWVFGLAVLVYQYDYFTWISNILNAPKIYWLTPVLAISILVGLGLDYDLFLFLRVLEYREAGFSTEAAMRKGALGVICSLSLSLFDFFFFFFFFVFHDVFGFRFSLTLIRVCAFVSLI